MSAPAPWKSTGGDALEGVFNPRPSSRRPTGAIPPAGICIGAPKAVVERIPDDLQEPSQPNQNRSLGETGWGLKEYANTLEMPWWRRIGGSTQPSPDLSARGRVPRPRHLGSCGRLPSAASSHSPVV